MTIKPFLFLDCDGVCSDFVGATLDVAKRHGHAITRDQITSWDYYDVWPEEVRVDLFDLCNTDVFWRGLAPIPQPDGVTLLSLVTELEEHYEVIVATSPWPSCPMWRPARLAWVKEHLGVKERQVMIGAPKRALGDGVMVDDAAKHLRGWVGRGSCEPGETRRPRRGLLVDHPYNRDEDLKFDGNSLDIVRVQGLAGAVAHLRERGWPAA